MLGGQVSFCFRPFWVPWALGINPVMPQPLASLATQQEEDWPQGSCLFDLAGVGVTLAAFAHWTNLSGSQTILEAQMELLLSWQSRSLEVKVTRLGNLLSHLIPELEVKNTTCQPRLLCLQKEMPKVMRRPPHPDQG